VPSRNPASLKKRRQLGRLPAVLPGIADENAGVGHQKPRRKIATCRVVTQHVGGATTSCGEAFCPAFTKDAVANPLRASFRCDESVLLRFRERRADPPSSFALRRRRASDPTGSAGGGTTTATYFGFSAAISPAAVATPTSSLPMMRSTSVRY